MADQDKVNALLDKGMDEKEWKAWLIEAMPLMPGPGLVGLICSVKSEKSFMWKGSRPSLVN
ncbi:hypothetical protein HML84_07810 [Alcanivorax sp. IO_7]|nr:hypothetical protein HML84_07810 [Alcanivorax sp. IO_7]